MSPSLCEGRFASFAAPPRAVHERPLRDAFPLLFLLQARFYGHFRGGSSPCAFSGAQGGHRLLVSVTSPFDVTWEVGSWGP